MTPRDITRLMEDLTERDLAVLASLRSCRLLTTELIRRLHFRRAHTTVRAAASAATRTLTRLEAQGLVARLDRRIGGVRAGSSGIVWHLGSTGERVVRTLRGESRRRRYMEPSQTFVAHTLAVADLAVQLRELADRPDIELLRINFEPDCWRSFVSPHGAVEWLKPDLHAITATARHEYHWYLEVDLATEHPTAVQRKAQAYQRYAATGAYQARHGVFPAVVWVVPNVARQQALNATLAAHGAAVRVVTVDQFADVISAAVQLSPEAEPNDST